MAQLKKILISLPDTLLEQVDEFAGKDGVSRSEFIRKILSDFVDTRKKQEIREQLEKGYQIMAEINSEWAEFCVEADNQTQFGYEEKLSESE